MLVSVVISERDEGHNLTHTIHSIVNDLETFLTPNDWEIIIVPNCSHVDRSDWLFLAERGMYSHENIRIHHDPIAGNVSARNKGAKIARGKWLFFSDAHMSYRIGSFKAMVDALEKHGGIVHPAVQWMGGYDPSSPSYQYSIKLGSRIYGTWNYIKISDDPFYIPVSGHCCLGVSREQFLAWNGYHPMFRCYGGGELYLDLKWWMLGSTSMCVPKALGYHLSAGRGYNYHQDDFIHNMMLMSLTLGSDAFAERVWIHYNTPHHSTTINRLYDEAIQESKEDAAWIYLHRKRTFYDLFDVKPWDVLNENLHGNSNSGFLIYHDTWLAELDETRRSLYQNSEKQKGLEKKILQDWGRYVYKNTSIG
jgi:glycosyltransferase involved in cell wall biosynthesis